MVDYIAEPDTLHDFRLESFSDPGYRSGPTDKPVYWIGDGPGIVLMPEMPGLTPEVASCARRLAAEGFTIAVPSLFGTPGKPASNGYVASSVARACVSKEFTAFRRGSTSPVTSWLRALARDVHRRCGGPGVGVIGMCFTGGFALGMFVEPAVLVGVLSQPSLPLTINPRAKSDLGVSADDLDAARERVADDACLIGMRFTNDSFVPAERFARLREEFGDDFIGIEIDSSPGNPGGYAKDAHSVLTLEHEDAPGTATAEAWQLLLSHFRERLLPRSGQ